MQGQMARSPLRVLVPSFSQGRQLSSKRVRKTLWFPLCFAEEVLFGPTFLSNLADFQGSRSSVSGYLLGAGERMVAGQ